jgi:hypothetical protein
METTYPPNGTPPPTAVHPGVSPARDTSEAAQEAAQEALRRARIADGQKWLEVAKRISTTGGWWLLAISLLAAIPMLGLSFFHQRDWVAAHLGVTKSNWQASAWPAVVDTVVLVLTGWSLIHNLATWRAALVRLFVVVFSGATVAINAAQAPHTDNTTTHVLVLLIYAGPGAGYVVLIEASLMYVRRRIDEALGRTADLTRFNLFKWLLRWVFAPCQSALTTYWVVVDDQPYPAAAARARTWAADRRTDRRARAADSAARKAEADRVKQNAYRLKKNLAVDADLDAEAARAARLPTPPPAPTRKGRATNRPPARNRGSRSSSPTRPTPPRDTSRNTHPAMSLVRGETPPAGITTPPGETPIDTNPETPPVGDGETSYPLAMGQQHAVPHLAQLLRAGNELSITRVEGMFVGDDQAQNPGEPISRATAARWLKAAREIAAADDRGRDAS